MSQLDRQKDGNSKFRFGSPSDLNCESEMEALNVDVNSNPKTEPGNEANLYELFDIALKSGRLFFFGSSYSIQPSRISLNDFTVKNKKWQQIAIRFLHVGFFLWLTMPFFCENIYLSPCCLVNYIKKGLHVVLIFCNLTSYYVLEVKGRKGMNVGLIGIYVQCVLLQKKFKAMGLHFPNRNKVRAFGWSVVIGTCLLCLGRQWVFSAKGGEPWYIRYGRFFARSISFGIWTPSPNNTDVLVYLGALGVIFDGLVANYWFYCQVFHFFFVLTIWIVFDRLNGALKTGYLHVKNLPEVMDLHFQSTKLLNTINQYLSPLTFCTLVYTMVCLCLWTNYIAIDRQLKLHYIAALCFFLKATLELVLEADVNYKAHQITEWLECSCAEIDKFPSVDRIKFAIFTAQIYNKDCTGLKGLNFFVVTPRLAITVAGIVVTYTVAVSQFCHLQ